MPSRKNDEQEFVDDDHKQIVEFARDYFDDEDEREEFVTWMMLRRGYTYTEKKEWKPPERQEPSAPGFRGPASSGRPTPPWLRPVPASGNSAS